MKERPIIFTGESVRAILEGRKTQTRRVMTLQPDSDGHVEVANDCAYLFGERGGQCTRIPCLYRIGDRLWVKEAFAVNAVYHVPYGIGRDQKQDQVQWRADKPQAKRYEEWVAGRDMWMPNATWRTPLFMPRWASRITLEVTEVRVEQLQNISNSDAVAEGVQRIDRSPYRLDGYGLPGWSKEDCCFYPRDAYAKLWNHINGNTYPWDSNPWCWCVSFVLVKS